jgi:hypothetical protein
MLFLRRADPSAQGLVAPEEQFVASDVRSLSKPPESMSEFVKVKTENRLEPSFGGGLKQRAPLIYRLAPGRDLPARRNSMMHCTGWVTIFDYAERELLLQHSPSIPKGVVDNHSLLDRLSFYVGPAQADDVLSIEVESMVEPCERAFHGADAELVSVGVLTSVLHVRQVNTQGLIAACRVKKVLLVPANDPGAVEEALASVDGLSRS